MTVTPPIRTVWLSWEPSTFPPAAAAMVDDDRTFGHVAEHFRANQPRRRFAGNQRGRDGEIGFGELFGHGFLLAF